MTTAIRSESNRSVVNVNGVDRVAINDDGSMELLTPAAGTPTGNDVPTAGQLGFGKMYESLEQTITAGGPLTLPHGLGKAPIWWRYELVCKVAEFGYSIGDRVCPTDLQYTQSAVTSSGVSIVPDPINLNLRFGTLNTTFMILHKTTGVANGITNSNWRLVVRAWA